MKIADPKRKKSIREEIDDLFVTLESKLAGGFALKGIRKSSRVYCLFSYIMDYRNGLYREACINANMLFKLKPHMRVADMNLSEYLKEKIRKFAYSKT